MALESVSLCISFGLAIRLSLDASELSMSSELRDLHKHYACFPHAETRTRVSPDVELDYVASGRRNGNQFSDYILSP